MGVIGFYRLAQELTMRMRTLCFRHVFAPSRMNGLNQPTLRQWFRPDIFAGHLGP
jgi:hypothetical protein